MIVRQWDISAIRLTGTQGYRHEWPDTEDLFRFDGIGLTVRTAASQPIRLRVTLHPLQNGRPEFIRSAVAEVLLPPGGGQVELPFTLFDSCRMVRAHLRYLHAMTLTLPPDAPDAVLTELGAYRRGDLLADAETSSTCVGACGETLRYRVRLRNGLEHPRQVMLHAEASGHEVLQWCFPETVLLPSRGETVIELSAVMTSALPAGGCETRAFTVMADGREATRLTLHAARRQPSPFLLHTADGWTALRRVIAADAGVRAEFERAYWQPAMAWVVPEPATHHRFVYTANSHERLLETAVAWKLTGAPALREKLVQWLTGFADEKYGYLATRYCYFEFPKTPDEAPADRYLVHHANSGGWVQEGEFMTRLAVTYDLLREENCLPPRVHQRLEECMRAYMDFADWRLTDGDGNNFQICEASAALHFALLLQDEMYIRRFLSGTNGLYALIGAVFSDDGSYFEGASGYMKLAAEVLGRTAIACAHGGRNLRDAVVPAACERQVMHAPWSCREAAGEKPFLGMRFERFAPVERPVRCLKDYYDCLLRLVDDAGVLFSANDSNEQSFCGVMQLAYHLYHDPAYLPVAKKAERNDLLYGLHMLPMGLTEKPRGLHVNTGNGFAVLRERTAEHPVQTVLKFGQHGGYHGHFDRLSLLSVMRDGTTFHNNEYAWYGYGSFLFKMWVQTSMAHNMAVVDDRMQEPTPCEVICQQEGEDFCAVCAQTVSRWSDPPYGGQTPYPVRFPEEKCAREGRWILPPDTPRPQGDIGEYSDPVFQRRLVVLTEGCCFVWDYLEAEQAHTFDCLYHPMGRLEGDLPPMRLHTARLNRDPFGAGQFIMNCHHYALQEGIRLHFVNGRGRVNPNDIVDFAAHATLHAVYPPRQTMIVGRYPERQDTFADEAEYQSADMLTGEGRKTVVLRQHGKRALFITALEIGRQPPDIAEVKAVNGECIRIRRRDGRERLISVSGMTDRDKKDITVQLAAGEGDQDE